MNPLERKLQEIEGMDTSDSIRELTKLAKKEKDPYTKYLLEHKLKYVEAEVTEEKFMEFLEAKQKKLGRKAPPLTPSEISLLKTKFIETLGA